MNILQPWPATHTFRTPVEQEHARLCVITLFLLSGGAVAWLPISLLAFSDSGARLLALASSLAVWLCSGAALMLLRRGSVVPGIIVTASGIFCAVTLVLLATGLTQSGALLLTYALPLTLVGLAWGRRGILLFGGLCFAVVGGLAVAQLASLPFVRDTLDAPLAILGTFALALLLLALFLDQFGLSLRRALAEALVREEALQSLSNTLESAVAKRTEALTNALEMVQQREARLAETLDDLQRSQRTVEQLSAPVLPVLPGVLVLPIVGTLDGARSDLVTRSVLEATAQTRARHVILDITGLPLLDTAAAQALLGTTEAVRLLGAEVLLVGARPEVAQTVVSLGIDLSTLTAYADLQAATSHILAADGWSRR